MSAPRIFTVRRLDAEQDALALLSALQAEFPQDLIHLLIGLDTVVVNRDGGDQGRDDPVEIAPDDPRWSAQEADEQGPQANILARYCTGRRIVLVSVPPSEDIAFHAARFRKAGILSSGDVA